MKEINIADFLIKKRSENNITQNKLAFDIGVSKKAVEKWEAGESYPDITLLPQLATYFGVTIEELLGL